MDQFWLVPNSGRIYPHDGSALSWIRLWQCIGMCNFALIQWKMQIWVCHVFFWYMAALLPICTLSGFCGTTYVTIDGAPSSWIALLCLQSLAVLLRFWIWRNPVDFGENIIKRVYHRATFMVAAFGWSPTYHRRRLGRSSECLNGFGFDGPKEAQDDW